MYKSRHLSQMPKIHIQNTNTYRYLNYLRINSKTQFMFIIRISQFVKCKAIRWISTIVILQRQHSLIFSSFVLLNIFLFSDCFKGKKNKIESNENIR